MEVDPGRQPEGFDAGGHPAGRVAQGEVVGVELVAENELAGGVEVEEGDPERSTSRPAQTQDAVKGLLRSDREKRSSSPRNSTNVTATYSRTSMPYKLIPSPLRCVPEHVTTRYVTRGASPGLRCALGHRETSFYYRVQYRRALLSYADMEPRGALVSDRRGRSLFLNQGDRDLVIAASKGDVEAFAKLVRDYSSLVYRVALRLLGNDDAQDASQEVWVRVWRNIRNFRERAPSRPGCTGSR